MSEPQPIPALRRLKTWAVDHQALLAKLAWLGLILLLLGSFKVDLTETQDNVYIDGGYYTSIAVFVRDGLGLKTNISLYHQAYSYFPHPTSVSPLWPLLYGYAARIFPLFEVAFWLPMLLYVTALIAAWGWGSTLMPQSLFRSLPYFDAGHVLALMLGIHREFFQFTSAPYTEGLAFTLLFAVLWRFAKIWHRPTHFRGIEIGLLLALVMLGRAQFAIVAIAMFMALGWAVVVSEDRKPWIWVTAGAAVTYVAVIGSYYLWLRTFVGNGPIAALLRFDQGWETSVLSEFHPMVNTNGLKEYVLDRAKGFEIAFDHEGRFPYRRSFWMLQYSIPAALPLLVIAGAKWLRRERLTEAWRWLKTSDAFLWIFVLLLALGGFFSIHTIHKDYFSEWHFHRRQGLTAILLFFLCLVFLFRRRYVGPALGALILGSSLYLGLTNLDHQVKQASRGTDRVPGQGFKGTAKWLQAEAAKRDGKLTIAMAGHVPQRMAFTTPDVGYHWIYAKTSYEDIETLVDDLHVDYIALNGQAHRWKLKRDKRFNLRFKRVAAREGVTIYGPK